MTSVSVIHRVQVVTSWRRLIFAAWLVAAAWCCPLPLPAADLYWSGTGTWNTTDQVWGTSTGGPYAAATWSNIAPDSAIFEGTAGTVTLGEPITAAGLTFSTTGYTVTGNTLTLSGTPTIAANVDATIASTLAGSAALTKSGAGTLVLGAVNTYTGGTVVEAGTLQLNVGGSAGTVRGSLEIQSGATVLAATTDALGWGTNRVTQLDIIGGAYSLNISGNNVVAWSGTVNLTGGHIQARANNANVYFGGTDAAVNVLSSPSESRIDAGDGVSGAGVVLQDTSGAVAFGVADGAAAVDLRVGLPILHGSQSNVLIKNGSGVMVLEAGNSLYRGGTSVNAGTLRVTGTRTSSGAGALGIGNVTINNGGSIEVAGTAFNMLYQSDYDLTINAGGTLSAANSVNNAQNIRNLVLNGGTLTSNDVSSPFGNWIVRNVVVGGSQASVINSLTLAVAAGTFSFDVADVVEGNDLLVSSNIVGGDITKSGAGTMELTGSNTYAGTTAVTAGTLLINGDNSAATGAVAVDAGATLGGTGTVGGATTITGLHSPGASPGLQTFTNGLSYASAGTLVWELSANTALSADRGTLYDGINLTTAGALSIDPLATIDLVFDQPLADLTPSTVDWTNALWGSDQQWLIADVSSPVTWDGTVFGTLNVGADSLGALLSTVRPNASFSLADDSGDLVLQYFAVPEPGTLALLATGIAAGVLRRRSRMP